MRGLRFVDHARSEEHTSELQSRPHLVCRLLLEKKKRIKYSRQLRVDVRLGLLRVLVDRSLHRLLTLDHVSIAFLFFFFNDTATTEIYTLSLHDALPITQWRTPWAANASRIAPGNFTG